MVKKIKKTEQAKIRAPSSGLIFKNQT